MYNTVSVVISKEILSLTAKIEEKKGYRALLSRYVDTSKLFPLKDTIKKSVETVTSALKYEEPVDMTGYTMALNWIYADYKTINITEETIDKLYNMVENLPSGSKIIKSYEETVEQEEPQESFGSMFGGMSLYEDEPAKAEKNEPEYKLRDLTDWLNRELNEGKVYPLLIISSFIASFLNLKPYPQTNSRLSRLLCTLLMLKTGYDYAAEFSLDATIDREYGLYETAYKSAMFDEDFDINFWNVVFFKILEKHALEMYENIKNIQITAEPDVQDEYCPLCELADNINETRNTCETKEAKTTKKAKKTEKKNTEKPSAYSDLPALQIQILELFDKDERITISGVVETTKANLNTVKKHLASMVEKSLIEKHGKTRGAWYTRV